MSASTLGKGGIKKNKLITSSQSDICVRSLCVSSASSKAERPPSLSLYPDGMVRGGLGGARMIPGKDIWQVSELGHSTFSSAYQVGQTSPVLLHNHNRSLGSGKGEGPALLLLATPTRTTSLPTPACVTFVETIFALEINSF